MSRGCHLFVALCIGRPFLAPTPRISKFCKGPEKLNPITAHPSSQPPIYPLPLQQTSKCLFSEGSSRQKLVCQVKLRGSRVKFEKIANEGTTAKPMWPFYVSGMLRSLVLCPLEVGNSRKRWTVQGMAMFWWKMSSEGTELTQMTRPRHPLRCQLCRERHGPRYVSSIFPNLQYGFNWHVSKLTRYRRGVQERPAKPGRQEPGAKPLSRITDHAGSGLWTYKRHERRCTIAMGGQ